MPILHWLTRETDLKLSGNAPYRLLEAMDELSYGDLSNGNMLIQGDNLDALKALLPYYAGAVKCIYIDPPYNTRNAFEHYDDNLEHTKWLSMIYPRLELLHELMAEDGSIWVSIDDHEAHYLKVVMDEIFGRKNFITSVIWRKNYSPKSSAKHFSEDHDYILIYAKNSNYWRPLLLPRTPTQDSHYTNPDKDPRGPWMSDNLTARNPYSLGLYSVTCPSGRTIDGPPTGRYWSISHENLKKLDLDNRIWWGKDGNGMPRRKRFLSEVSGGRVPQTLWSYEDVGHTQDAKKEIVSLFGNDVFGTPKPERLIQRIVHISTTPGDLILDSFLGSGTTAAVAQKMGRRFIGIEMGEHAVTHCAPRLRKVVDGEQGGISEAMNWHGGGGFRFFKLGDPIFEEDGSIRTGITFAQLAAHVWFSETKTPLTGKPESPLLGVHDGTAYYLLFNGILKDKSVGGGNVLTSKILEGLPPHDGPRAIYGERCLFGADRLRDERIIFKHTPYDIKGR